MWGNCGESKENVLQKLHNSAVMIVTNSSYSASTALLLSKLQWSFIDESINGETSNMVYKSTSNIAPIYLYN